jgi:hypothetical protein
MGLVTYLIIGRKGKPVERQGRKATGLRRAPDRDDSRVAEGSHYGSLVLYLFKASVGLFLAENFERLLLPELLIRKEERYHGKETKTPRYNY